MAITQTNVLISNDTIIEVGWIQQNLCTSAILAHARIRHLDRRHGLLSYSTIEKKKVDAKLMILLKTYRIVW